MAMGQTQICIYDSHGNRICYSNHVVATTVHYEITYHPTGAHAAPIKVGEGDLPGEATRLEKLAVLVPAVLGSPYKRVFDDWDRVSTRTKK